MTEVGLPVRWLAERTLGRDREDGTISGVGERVAECKDAGVGHP